MALGRVLQRARRPGTSGVMGADLARLFRVTLSSGRHEPLDKYRRWVRAQFLPSPNLHNTTRFEHGKVVAKSSGIDRCQLRHKGASPSANCVGAVGRKNTENMAYERWSEFCYSRIMLRFFSPNIHGLLPIFGIWFAMSALACGGQVDSGNTPGDGSGAGSGSTGGSGSDSTASGSNGATSGFGQHPLADCAPGFAVEQASADKPCNYFIDTTCYSKQDDACGCACPHDQGAVLCIIDANSFLPGTDAYGVFCVPR